MCNVHDLTLGMTFDGYLKLFQLEGHKLEHDFMLVDEAQDVTPVVADIVLSQKKPTILVGDPHQSIYGFRGAVNAMAKVNATETLCLTQSFRFGPEISFV